MTKQRAQRLAKMMTVDNAGPVGLTIQKGFNWSTHMRKQGHKSPISFCKRKHG